MKTCMQEPEVKTWLVTGASGRIGRMLMHHWALVPPKGIRFVPQYRQSSTQGILWDMLDGPDALKAWIVLNRPVDGLLILSGATPDKSAEMQLNIALVHAAIKAAKAASIPRILVASSSAVYGSWSQQPYGESTPTKPLNAYGRAKLEAEMLCKEAACDSLAITCLRIGNVAGADALLARIASAPVKLDQFQDGHGPKRSYIGPQTLADVLVTLINSGNPLPPVLNVAAPQPVFMQALLEAADLPWQFIAAGDGAVQNVALDTQLLSSFYTFKANAQQPEEIIRQWRAQAGAA
jgi:UDP-glucose 4-epimerase